MNWSKIIECVPNFSEGRDLEKIDKIVAPFHGKSGVKLLDYSNDEDHNRLVVTLVGEPEALRDAVIEAIGIAVRLIDLNHHSGQHPRMGAVDVVPFIPIKNTTMEEAVALSKEVASRVAELYNLPVFLYEKSATAPHRENLASVRKGEFEGMAEKIRLPEWQPDFGPAERHPTAGTVAIGARMPLVAYNINLSTNNLEIATKIAKNIRHINGGLRYPMLLVDKIIEIGKNHIVGIKNFTSNEPFFQGHFPQEPVVPGVLLIEAMAQTGGLLTLNTVEDPSSYSTYFMKIDNVKFRQKVVPGDTAIFHVSFMTEMRRGCAYMKGYVFVGDKITTEAEFMAQITKNK